MENEIVKILTEDYGIAENDLATKVANSIGGLYSENYVNIRTKDYLEKSIVWMQSYVKTMERDSVDRLQLDHLISEIEEHLRNN